MKKETFLIVIAVFIFTSLKASTPISDAFLEKIFSVKLKEVHKVFSENSRLEIIEGHILIKKDNNYIVEVYTDYDSSEVKGIEIYSKEYSIGSITAGASISHLLKMHPYAKLEINHDDGFSLNTSLNTSNCNVKDKYSIYVILRANPEHQYDYEAYVSNYIIKDIQNTERIQSILIFKK